MRLPEPISSAIEKFEEKAKPSNESQKFLEHNYRKKNPSSAPLFDSPLGLSTYLRTRAAPIYAAAFFVLNVLKKRCPELKCQSFVDLGSGPGTAAWAAFNAFPEIEEALLLEKNPQAIEAARFIAQEIPELQKAKWLLTSLEETELPLADLAIASYVLGELKNPLKIVEKWALSQIPYLILIEPGTPKGFALIRSIRENFIQNVLAPCPHAEKCPMGPSDWCHFSVRVERSRIHRHLKKGALSYEDEKYSYLILSKKKKGGPLPLPILSPPQKKSGHFLLKLCQADGKIGEKIISKKDENYKSLRKLGWGDFI